MENGLGKDTDRVKYIISSIIHLNTRYQNQEEFVNLNFKFLGNVINQNKVKPLLQFLLDKKIIETDNQYIVGKKSKGYTLTKQYLNSGYKQEEIKNKFILKKLNRQSVEPSIDSDPILAQVNNLMKRVYIHPDVKYYIKSLIGKPHPKKSRKKFTKHHYDNYCYMINQFRNQNWYNKRDRKTGRLFNSLCNLPKLMREYMFVDGKPLEEIDVGNMQPLGLVALIEKFLNNPSKNLHEDYYVEQLLLKTSGLTPYNSINEMMELKYLRNSEFINEFELYKKLVFNNKLYHFLIEKYKEFFNTSISKADLKTKFFTFILFGNFKYHSPIDMIALFRELFPKIWSIICDLKEENGYKYISLMLQKTEADIIINKVFVKYIHENPKAFLFPIHDAILTTPEHSEVLIERIKEEFEKIGLFSKVEKKSKNAIVQKINNQNFFYFNNSILLNKVKSIINKPQSTQLKQITIYHNTILYKLQSSLMNIIFDFSRVKGKLYIQSRSLII